MKKILFILLLFVQVYGDTNSTIIQKLSFECDIGQSDACLELADTYRIKTDYEKAASFYEKACDLKNRYGCYNLGLIYEYGCGLEGFVDYEKAFALFSKACKLGKNNNDACTTMENLKQEMEKENFYQPVETKKIDCDSLPVEIGGL
jgi:TPR repeat protein